MVMIRKSDPSKAKWTRSGGINSIWPHKNIILHSLKWINLTLLLLTYAAGGGPWPGAVRLAQPDARALEVIVRQAADTAGRIKVVVADVLDEEAVFWWSQQRAVHHWDNRGEKTDTGEVQQADIHFEFTMKPTFPFSLATKYINGFSSFLPVTHDWSRQAATLLSMHHVRIICFLHAGCGHKSQNIDQPHWCNKKKTFPWTYSWFSLFVPNWSARCTKQKKNTKNKFLHSRYWLGATCRDHIIGTNGNAFMSSRPKARFHRLSKAIVRVSVGSEPTG